MAFADVLAADRRLELLRALVEAPGNSLNEMVGKIVLAGRGHDAATALLRADLQYLSDHGLIRLERLPNGHDELWLAHLTVTGEDVAAGRQGNPGVARRVG